MAEVTYGADALGVLNDEGGVGSRNEFSKFSSGTTYKVKVLGVADMMMYYGYSSFKPRVNTFVAEKPSKKSAKGYPVEDLTPWDKAWKYHADLSEEFQDEHSQEAFKYKPQQRFAFGFYDITDGKLIVVDLSKKQGQAIYKTIKKYEKKLDKMAFELSKEGSSTNTTVSLSPLIDLEEDLTEKEQANFDKAPEEFDKKRFEGILFEFNEEQMVRKLHEAGFDVTKIGYEIPKPKEEGEDGESAGEAIDIEDDVLPF